MIRAVAIGLALAAPAPLWAAGQIALPQGCTGYVTVQKRGCTVSHLFTCTADPTGNQRRIDLDEDGMIYMGQTDAETQWIESHHIVAGTVDRLGPDPLDPASFTELVETGRDTWDFTTTSEPFAVTVYRGEDRLTGRTEVVDGVTLEETAFEVVVSDPLGGELYRVQGNEYIQRDWRTFVSGVRTITMPDEQFETDGRPVEFAFPGEPGFLANRPQYDCGMMMSKAGG